MSDDRDSDTPVRSREMEVMALLEQIIMTAEQAEGYIQDDSKITDRDDRMEIRQRMLHVRFLTMEVERLL